MARILEVDADQPIGLSHVEPTVEDRLADEAGA